MYLRVLVALIAMCIPAAGQQHAKERQALNNVHHETIVCIAYYTIMKQCVGNNPRGKEAAAQTGKVIENLTEFAVKLGKGINMTNDAMASRLKLSFEEQMGLIRGDCINRLIADEPLRSPLQASDREPRQSNGGIYEVMVVAGAQGGAT